MKVVEKFTSINGEGTRAGELAVFIRFKGCNLRCSYCDTMWANEPHIPIPLIPCRNNMRNFLPLDERKLSPNESSRKIHQY